MSGCISPSKVHPAPSRARPLIGLRGALVGVHRPTPAPVIPFPSRSRAGPKHTECAAARDGGRREIGRDEPLCARRFAADLGASPFISALPSGALRPAAASDCNRRFSNPGAAGERPIARGLPSFRRRNATARRSTNLRDLSA
jgi:hypothetical protein